MNGNLAQKTRVLNLTVNSLLRLSANPHPSLRSLINKREVSKINSFCCLRATINRAFWHWPVVHKVEACNWTIFANLYTCTKVTRDGRWKMKKRQFLESLFKQSRAILLFVLRFSIIDSSHASLRIWIEKSIDRILSELFFLHLNWLQ